MDVKQTAFIIHFLLVSLLDFGYKISNHTFHYICCFTLKRNALSESITSTNSAKAITYWRTVCNTGRPWFRTK